MIPLHMSPQDCQEKCEILEFTNCMYFEKMCFYILFEKLHLISPSSTINFTPLFYSPFHSLILPPHCSFLFYKPILLPNFNPSILPHYFTPYITFFLIAFFEPIIYSI